MRGLRLLRQGLPAVRDRGVEGHVRKGGHIALRRLRQVQQGMPRQCHHDSRGARMKRNTKWYSYLWIASVIYLALGLFNILFAWLGLLCFFIPLGIAAVKGSKAYCNRYCGRGQLFAILGGTIGLSRKKDMPKWMKSKAFRYGFLSFFLAMFLLMLWNTGLVFAGVRDLGQTVTLLWTFKLPWHWAYHGTLLHPGVAQFAFGFYGVMLTSTVLGLLTMLLFKPRSWCVYCPMGTMTQMICKAKNKKQSADRSAAPADM